MGEGGEGGENPPGVGLYKPFALNLSKLEQPNRRQTAFSP
jgi:hypothetical protein